MQLHSVSPKRNSNYDNTEFSVSAGIVFSFMRILVLKEIRISTIVACFPIYEIYARGILQKDINLQL